MKELLMVNLKNNQFDSIPDMLYALPKQTRIHIGANPMSEEESSTRFITYDDTSSFAFSPDRKEAHIPIDKQNQRLKIHGDPSGGFEDSSEETQDEEDKLAPPPTNTLSLSIPPTQRPIAHKNKKLKTINLRGRSLISIPEKLQRYSNMQQLVLSDNDIRVIPGWFNQLSEIEVLLCENNNISEIVPEALLLPRMQHLNLRGNKLTELPATICLCRKLRYLNLEYNQFEFLPNILTDLPMLETIRLRGNPLKEYPLVLTKIKNLRYISLGSEFSAWKKTLQKSLPNVQIL